MHNAQLFRSAALNKCQTPWLGGVILARPLSVTLLTLIAAGMASIIVCFFALATYTRRSTVSGQLVPDVGVFKVYPSQPGIVVKKLVREGQQIKKGDLLYLVSSERQSNASQGMQEIVSAQVALRQQSLREEVTRLRRLQVDEESALHRKIDGLQAEQSKTAQQIASQQERVQLAEDGVARTSQLLSHGYVSAEVAQQKQADLLDQRTRLEALQRDKLSADRELESQRNELTSLPLRQQNDLAQLQRLLASTEQEWTESEGKRRFAVLAPGGGIATAILAEVGQTVDLSRPLMSIMPADAVLQAYLYAPSSAIGFIRTNDHVLLRYQAYPYQKFGHATGRVSSVSRVALSLNEAVGNQHGNNGDPVYLVTVALDRQTITAYGRTQPLQAGMRVDADVLQEKRSLFEWVMEPLYSLSGKL